MPTKSTIPLTPQGQLLACLTNEAWRKTALTRGKNSVPGGHNACAATASQVYVWDLKIIKGVETWAETLVKRLKRTKLFLTGKDPRAVGPGFLIVCIDGDGPDGPDGNNDTDHVWHVVRVLGDGWYECFDNQPGPKSLRLSPTTYKRRLDGKDGKTPMRGWMCLK